MAKKGLGRGFESLIPTELVEDGFDPTSDEEAKVLKEIKLDMIVRDSNQPRKTFDQASLDELAQSIKEHGVLSPIVVVKENGKYQIIAGERRWRAAKIAGLKTIPCIVRTEDIQNRLELSIIENAQREDLNAIELATAYAKLKNEFNMTNADIAKRVGKSEITIVNTLRFLKLPEKAKKAMRDYSLTEGVMRPLIVASPEVIDKVLPKIIKEDWNARQVERYVSQTKKIGSEKANKIHHYIKQEDKIGKKYGVKVRIKTTTVTFSCKTEEQMQELLAKLEK
ncbi:ParB/RepB/Spo0J family partition protein [Candidatus Saccharibacteria bacterium]|nr:ParB/RepB/Spo0J family partition protein [Candidatus Saccharibacteria bacterium]MBR3233391.1 ParB/RepB/Spo0J family partition protein [Candidatus Saccharibacteria bacterium]